MNHMQMAGQKKWPCTNGIQAENETAAGWSANNQAIAAANDAHGD